jgi:hypothetical protein
MIFGVFAIGGASSNPPVGEIEIVTYYGFSFAMLLIGLVLIVKRPRQDSSA